MKKLVPSIGWVWLLFACAAKEDSNVGSNCDEGCELESAKVSCTALDMEVESAVYWALPDGGVVLDGGEVLTSLPSWCQTLPDELLVAEDKASCEVVMAPPTSGGDLEELCASSPALTPTEPGAPFEGCVVTQVSNGDSGAPGWFYDLEACGRNGRPGQLSIRFTGDFPEEYLVRTSCVAAVVATGAHVPGAADPNAPIAVDVTDCKFPPAPSAEAVGDACLPGYIHENGFDDRMVSVETNAAACPQGVCLVYDFEGDPRSDCVPEVEGNTTIRRCVDSKVAREHIYCSCDCGDLDGRAGCECPSGYSCKQVLEDDSATQRPPAGTSGQFCVKDGPPR